MKTVVFANELLGICVKGIITGRKMLTLESYYHNYVHIIGNECSHATNLFPIKKTS